MLTYVQHKDVDIGVIPNNLLRIRSFIRSFSSSADKNAMFREDQVKSQCREEDILAMPSCMSRNGQ